MVFPKIAHGTASLTTRYLNPHSSRRICCQQTVVAQQGSVVEALISTHHLAHAGLVTRVLKAGR
jgi:hypothetical protein